MRPDSPALIGSDLSIMSLGLSFIASGLLYIALFMPLTATIATVKGLDPLSVFLFENPASASSSSIFAVLAHGAAPNVFALATLYGWVCVGGGLLIIVGGIPRQAARFSAVLFGYLGTLFLVSLLHRGPHITTNGKVIFLYVLAAQYIAVSLPKTLTRNELSREKLDFLFTGIAALFTGWLLARRFGQAEVFFSGSVFLVISFVAMTISERLIRHQMSIMFVLTGDPEFTSSGRERSFDYRFFREWVQSALEAEPAFFVLGVLSSLPFPIVVWGVCRIL